MNGPIRPVLFDTTQAALEAAIAGASQRQQALAANLANANTPGYQRVDVDFHSTLAAALDDGGSGAADRLHETGFAAQVDASGATRADGSTVDVDAESITGLYTVLVDGDDMNEPIADAVRSILDGHVVLSRDLAHAGHYPAIDVLASVSRLVGEVVAPDVRDAGNEVRKLMAAYREKADLIAIGAYQSGSDRLTDLAIAARDPIDGFLRQAVDDPSSAEEADAALRQLMLLAGGDAAETPEPLAAPQPPPPPTHPAIPTLHIAA